MAITRVQQTSGTDTGFLSTVTTSAFGSSVTAGNYLILAWEGDAATIEQSASVPTDNKGGNTWIRAQSKLDSVVFDLEIWYTKVVNGGAGMTVTVTDGLGGADGLLIVEEWSGIASITPYDGSNSAFGTGNGALNSGAIATTNANDVIWVGGCVSSGSTTITAGTNFSNVTQVNTSFTTLGVGSRVVSGTGSYSGLLTSSVTNQDWLCAALALADTTVVQAPSTMLYLLNTTAISHPAAIDSATKSAVLPAGTDKTGSPGTALDMGSTAGVAQASTTTTTGTSAVLTSARAQTWVSNVLGGTNIAIGSWTVAFAYKESNAAANQKMAFSLYVLKNDGTVRGYIYDSTTGRALEFDTVERGSEYTFTGSAVSGVTSTDQLALEIWATGTQTGTTSRTITYYWNGTTDPANSSVSSAASYVSANDQNIFLVTTPTSSTLSGANYESPRHFIVGNGMGKGDTAF